MCIVLPKTDCGIKVADKDIEVYKILIIHKNEKVYKSPHQYYCYGTLDAITGRTFVDKISDCEEWTKDIVATSKGLYSYANAIYEIVGYPDGGYEASMFRCVIPKGSRYYTDGTEYCSDMLTIIEKLK